MKKLLIAISIFLYSTNTFSQCYDSSRTLSDTAEMASILACMQSQIDQLKNSTPNKKPVSSIPAGNVSATETVNNLQYQLEHCKRNGNTLSCSFILTSLDKERFEQVYEVVVFDELGGEYKTRSAKFIKGGMTSKQLMGKVPVKLNAEFKNFDKKAARLVKIKFRDSQGTLEFRDILVQAD